MFAHDTNTEGSKSTIDFQTSAPNCTSPFFHTLHEWNYAYAHSPSGGQVVGRVLALLQRKSELAIWCGFVVFPVWNGCTSDGLLHILCVFCIGDLHVDLPFFLTWIITKIINLFLRDAELSIGSILLYPLDGVIRIKGIKLGR